jgi:hypothetical protein
MKMGGHHFDANPDLDQHKDGNLDPDLHHFDADPHNWYPVRTLLCTTYLS